MSSDDEDGSGSGASPNQQRPHSRDLRDKREAQTRRMLEHQVGSGFTRAAHLVIIIII